MSRITGDTPHDNTDGGNPLKIGGKAATSRPAAVAAADRVNGYFDAHGRQVVVAELGQQDVVRKATISSDMSAAPTAISDAPGAGLKLVVDDLQISTPAAAVVTLTEETTGTVLGTVHTSAGGVSHVRLGKLPTANKKLMAQLASAGDVSFILIGRTEP